MSRRVFNRSLLLRAYNFNKILYSSNFNVSRRNVQLITNYQKYPKTILLTANYHSSQSSHASSADELYKELKQAPQNEKDQAVEASKKIIPHDKASRFGRSLFLESSQFIGGRAAVIEDFRILNDFISTDTDAHKYFKDPITPEYSRFAALDAYFKANKKVHPISKRALTTMAIAKTLPSISNVYETLKQLEDLYLNKIIVTITLDSLNYDKAKIIELIKTVKSRFVPDGSVPEFILKADPKLLGGYTVEVGREKVLDLSYKMMVNKRAKDYIASLDSVIKFIENFEQDRAKWPLDKSSIDEQQWNWFFKARDFFLKKKLGGQTAAAEQAAGISDEQEFDFTKDTAKRVFDMYQFETKKPANKST